MTVSKRVVFADFAKNVCLTNLSRNERLLELEAFFFYSGWHVDFWTRFVCCKEVLSGKICRLWHSYKWKNSFETVVNFGIKSFLCVFHDVELGVSNPRLDQPSINLTGLQHGICWLLVELFGAFGRGHHVNDCFVALVTELDGWPACFVKDCLPNIFIDVSLPVHDTAVNQNDRVRVWHLCDINENLFEIHLEFHEELLEFYGLDKVHIGRVDTSTSLF